MASDTSLVFNLLGRDNISRVLGAVKNAFRSAGKQAEDSMDEASRATERLDRQIEEVERDLAKLSAEFARTGDKTLFGKINRDRALLTQLKKIRATLDDTGSSGDKASGKVGRLVSVFQAGASGISGFVGSVGSVGGAVGSATSSIWGIVSAILAMLAALAAIGPALAIAGGALGSLPGLLGGGIAVLGTLKLGLSGLSSEYDRLTKSSGGGGGGGGGATKAAKDFTAANRAVEQAIRGVAQAERAVRDAQREALEAQQAINEAREEAATRMRDQALDLEGAQLDQKQAIDDLAAAALDLEAAKSSGNQEEIDKAQLAYDRQALAVKQAKNRVDDLTKAVAENTRKGVEGADEVVDAKDREKQARQRVADSIEQEKEAEERLADARKALADLKTEQASGAAGGGGGAGQEITKLAPAAREFLNTIIGLRPAFERLRLDVQQRLFAGLAKPMQNLADVWLPRLHIALGGFADTFNGIAKTLFESASKKTFVDNIMAGLEGVRGMIDRVGQALAGPFVDAWGRLSAASVPFLEKIGDLLAKGIEKFSAWIRKADDSGKLKSFFEGAASTLGKVVEVGGKVFKIIGQVIGIIYPQAKSAGDSVLDSASKALDKVSEWLNKPENQQKIQAIVDGVKEMSREFGKLLKTLFSPTNTGPSIFDRIMSGIKLVTGTLKVLNSVFQGTISAMKWLTTNGGKAWASVKSGLSSAYSWVSSQGGRLITWVKQLPGKIGKAASGMWDGIKSSFKSAINWIVGKWNNLSFTVGGGSFLGATIPSATFNTPNIPYLAKGGSIDRAGMAVVGERGPELVHLSRGAQVTPLRGGAGAGGTLVIDIRGGDAEMRRLIRRWIRADNLLQEA